LLLSSLVGVALVWTLPRRYGLSAVAVLTLLSVSILSPASGLWLAGTSLLTVLIVRGYSATRHRGLLVFVASAILLTLLFVSRQTGGFFWIGGAYFTLRNMHVLIDWWMQRLRVPTTADYLKYSLFLPVLMAGPIHRLDNFQRQLRRQRLDSTNLFSGAERALLGLAQALVIPFVLRRLQYVSTRHMETLHPFLLRWIEGSFDWLILYFSFAGLTSLALGLSLMMGLKLEENFNRPWAAANLIEFWSRWHMTLSHWCRDYVFYPVAAVTRLPIVGLLLAMLAMGLWHDTSAYYVLWAVWQSLGIFLTHVTIRFTGNREAGLSGRILGTASVFAWLSLTKPMVLQFLDIFS